MSGGAPAEADSELQVLSGYLDAYRAAARWKVEGLDLEQATRSLVPSQSTLLGILKHLSYVERWWFQSVIAGRAVDRGWTDDDPDADYRIEPDESIESIVARYDAECAISRAIFSDIADPAVSVPFRDDTIVIRDILVHMVEEIARHVGHMDILREQVDGSTGGFPPGGLPWE